VTATPRLDRDRLLEEVAALGPTDLGADTWQEGLDRLLAALVEEARLHDLGVEVAAGELVAYLANRAAIVAWRADHPEVAAGRVDAPIVIVGQPRTGTTILYDLLAQDPALRAPLSWEVDHPVPPPTTAGYLDDPRIAETQATLDLADSLVPGFVAFHAIGARLAQECVRITGGDLRSMIFPTQYRIPSYNRWLLHEADLAPAYRWHRCYLQHLQSQHHTGRWLLKSPAHLWHLPALLGEYPDAVVVQTHRDPLRVVSSISALAASLRRMYSDEASVTDAAVQYADDIFVGLERGMAFRDEHPEVDARCIDVQLTDFLDDPIATIRSIYVQAGMELTAETEQAMRAFLAAHPGDGGGGGGRYRFADTGLDAGLLRDRARPYQERYAVVSEPVA
jgi:hypothetical protein